MVENRVLEKKVPDFNFLSYLILLQWSCFKCALYSASPVKICLLHSRDRASHVYMYARLSSHSLRKLAAEIKDSKPLQWCLGKYRGVPGSVRLFACM